MSAAPWSMSTGLRCHHSRFGLRHDRSTLLTSASNHSTRLTNCASTGNERTERRLHALDPAADAGRHFRWLTAARSTVVRAGPVHTDFAADPAAELERLLTALVRPLT
ncbi:DUF3037 domain-containing protein [Amycolatopsis sp. CA-161197]|uniref:DUF3037 domain-containing protein n=1 Tax=Amycolatopsis sp. CA-161197 TaxID=3239922 RepID=UPI003D8BFAF1